MNGFALCIEILKVDVNVRICFMSAGEVNHKAIRELYPTISIGCFIKKPIAMEYLKENKGRARVVIVAIFHSEELANNAVSVLQFQL